MAYWFHVLRSKRDGTLYKGVAQDVQVRLAQHNGGKTKSLRHRVPFEVIYVEEWPTRQQALAREKWSKTLRGGKELQALLSQGGSLPEPA
jgi:putative endonuclease